MVRYDAAIIGAGADGLAAAVTLARLGLKVIVLERNEQPGGRCITREFHPGFRASPFCDEVPPIPAEIFWALDLARHGATFMPRPVVTGLWADRAIRQNLGETPWWQQSMAITKAALSRAEADVELPPTSIFRSRRAPDPWPADFWATQSLADLLDCRTTDDKALMMAVALEGSTAHADLAGSALHQLIAGGAKSGMAVGGLQALTDALLAAVSSADIQISCGLEVTEVICRGERAIGLRLADGAEIAASAIVSTLDLKRTFLSLFSWNALPRETSRRVGAYRTGGSTARVLIALDSLPERPTHAGGDVFAGPIHVSPRTEVFGTAYAAWRAGTMAEALPITLRFVSAHDPQLCPAGAATLTATIDGVPAQPFDGSWTHEKRNALLGRVLDRIEEVLPGLKARIRACELTVPSDMEQALGCTDGDLWGGEIAADQMLAFRPGLDAPAPRTPFKGLYVAGRSTNAGVLGTCVSGVFAARAIANDLRSGRLK